MTNKSLKEIDKQFDKQKFHDAWAEDESNRIKAFIHKVIAERDEALRKLLDEYGVLPPRVESTMLNKTQFLSLLTKE